MTDPIVIDDRALAHLRTVIVTKLRRGERFTVSWKHTNGEVSRRSTIWVSPAVPLIFVFDSPDSVQLNVNWLRRLSDTANRTSGIELVDEDAGVLTLPSA